jgi:hypothetical protein
MQIISKVYKSPADFNQDVLKKDFESSSTADLFIVFINSNRDEWKNAVPHLYKTFPQATIVGGSSAGHISGEFIYDSECVVSRITFNKGKIKTHAFKDVSADNSESIGMKIAEMGNSQKSTAGLILSEGLNINGSQLVAGINKINQQTVYSGGLSADGTDFKETQVIYNDQILSNGLVVVFFDDQFVYESSSAGGWNSFGVERIVTKSKNNIILEIDDKPALELYREYLGSKADLLPAYGLNFPICTVSKDHATNKEIEVVRTLLGIDLQLGSIILAGDVPEGSIIKLMKSTRKDLIVSAQNLYSNKISSFQQGEGDILSFIVSCVGRRIVMGVNTEEELEYSENKSKIVPVGFYSYGEISSEKCKASLLNQTFTLTLIQEKI